MNLTSKEVKTQYQQMVNELCPKCQQKYNQGQKLDTYCQPCQVTAKKHLTKIMEMIQ